MGRRNAVPASERGGPLGSDLFDVSNWLELFSAQLGTEAAGLCKTDIIFLGVAVGSHIDVATIDFSFNSLQ